MSRNQQHLDPFFFVVHNSDVFKKKKKNIFLFDYNASKFFLI